ncbi:hypothetical protein GCM10023116_13480 [Kistimonas scapharcae]|uniref:Uncharacterized protein n=1 Tax=Kistimonas scapharcae TaxID=1036133 RepID=A0ABP8UZA2_9GAMM
MRGTVPDDYILVHLPAPVGNTEGVHLSPMQVNILRVLFFDPYPCYGVIAHGLGISDYLIRKNIKSLVKPLEFIDPTANGYGFLTEKGRRWCNEHFGTRHEPEYKSHPDL